MCDKLVYHRLRYDWSGTQSILASTFGIDYILDGMYRTDYILAGTDGTNYILLGLYVWQILYSSPWGTYFVMIVNDFTIAYSNKILCVFVLR